MGSDFRLGMVGLNVSLRGYPQCCSLSCIFFLVGLRITMVMLFIEKSIYISYKAIFQI